MYTENKEPSAGIFYINTGTEEKPDWKPIALYNNGIKFGRRHKCSIWQKLLDFVQRIFRRYD